MADYIIDLGPEGGDAGGEVIATGAPEEIVKVNTSYTAKYLKEKLKAEKRKKRA
jgi:excinuclease ABC subunit A